MILGLLAEALEPRQPRRYIGKHRAPRHVRHLALARMAPRPGAATATSAS